MMTLEQMAEAAGMPGKGVLEAWIAQGWLRPARVETTYVFAEIDVARARLIHDLAHELELGEAALPVVLSLLDQLYAARRQLRLVAGLVAEAEDAGLRARLAAALGQGTGG